MNWLKKHILKVVEEKEFWITIECRTGTWYADNPGNITNRCCFEILYSEKKKAYRLKTTGYAPESHSQYAKMTRAVAVLNQNSMEVESALASVAGILNGSV